MKQVLRNSVKHYRQKNRIILTQRRTNANLNPQERTNETEDRNDLTRVIAPDDRGGRLPKIHPTGANRGNGDSGTRKTLCSPAARDSAALPLAGCLAPKTAPIGGIRNRMRRVFSVAPAWPGKLELCPIRTYAPHGMHRFGQCIFSDWDKARRMAGASSSRRPLGTWSVTPSDSFSISI